MKPIVCIAGPTASGKSALAVRVAKSVGGEVINADSMQVYGDISVLSARPEEDEMSGVPHHLFGHVKGNAPYSTGHWVREVQPVILDCLARGVVPILTGGTGLYFKSLFDGIADIPQVSPEMEQRVIDEIERAGVDAIRAKCEEIDPSANSKVLGQDPQRLGRIYGVWLQTGVPLSQWQTNTQPIIPKANARLAVVLPDREQLYAKINSRFDQMVDLGGVEEAKHVAALGYSPKLPMMKAIGLSHLLRHLSGELSYEVAIDLAKRDSRRLAKRQMTWFRNQTSDWPKLTTQHAQHQFVQSLIGLELPD